MALNKPSYLHKSPNFEIMLHKFALLHRCRCQNTTRQRKLGMSYLRTNKFKMKRWCVLLCGRTEEPQYKHNQIYDRNTPHPISQRGSQMLDWSVLSLIQMVEWEYHLTHQQYRLKSNFADWIKMKLEYESLLPKD